MAEVTPSKMLELDSQLGLQITEILADQGRSMEHGAWSDRMAHLDLDHRPQHW